MRDLFMVVIELLIKNPKITQDILAELSGQSKRTISRIVKSLKDHDIIIKIVHKIAVWTCFSAIVAYYSKQ